MWVDVSCYGFLTALCYLKCCWYVVTDSYLLSPHPSVQPGRKIAKRKTEISSTFIKITCFLHHFSHIHLPYCFCYNHLKPSASGFCRKVSGIQEGLKHCSLIISRGCLVDVPYLVSLPTVAHLGECFRFYIPLAFLDH